MAEAASVAQPAAALFRKVLAQGVRGGAHVEWRAAAQAEPPVERLEDSKQPRLAPLTPLRLARQRQRRKRVALVPRLEEHRGRVSLGRAVSGGSGWRS